MRELALLIYLLISINSYSSVSKTVSSTAGNLNLTLTDTERTTVTNLTITGNINALDFTYLRDSMPVLAVLDLSQTTIEAYNGPNAPYDYYNAANTIPKKAFCDKYAYYNGGKETLTLIQLPTNITAIGESAFMACTGLEALPTLPPSLKEIGGLSFVNCSRITGNIHLPDSITTIGGEAFRGCTSANGTLHLPDSLTTLGFNCFLNCSTLTGDITIPEKITYLPQACFSNCSGFNGTINFRSSLDSIEFGAFSGCNKITGKITLPSKLEYLGASAFYNCTKITELELPASLSTIESNVFSGCDGLRKVTANNPTPLLSPDMGDNVFGFLNMIYDCKLYVPSNSINTYSNALQWEDFYSIESITTSNINTSKDVNYSMKSINGILMITDISTPSYISIFDINGNSIFQSKNKVTEIDINLKYNTLYIIKIGTETKKVIL